MPRTIVLTLAPDDRKYSTSEYWSVTENGRICSSLCWDEMLGAVARITLNESNSYSMQTVEQHKDEARCREARKPNPAADQLRALVKAMDTSRELAGVSDALTASVLLLKKLDDEAAESDVPF